RGLHRAPRPAQGGAGDRDPLRVPGQRDPDEGALPRGVVASRRGAAVLQVPSRGGGARVRGDVGPRPLAPARAAPRLLPAAAFGAALPASLARVRTRGRRPVKKMGTLVEGREVYHVRVDQTVREVARYMTERRVGAVPVLDGTRLAGILSER